MPTPAQVTNRQQRVRVPRHFTATVNSGGPVVTVTLDPSNEPTTAVDVTGTDWQANDRVLVLVTAIGNWIIGDLRGLSRPDLQTIDPALIVAAAGWTVTSVARLLDLGNGARQAYLNLQATRTGAAIAAGSTGNFADSTVATTPAQLHPPERVYNMFGGATIGEGYVTTGGSVVIAAAVPNTSIPTGGVIWINASYPAQ